MLVSDYLTHWAVRTPVRTALVDGPDQLSYRDLDDAASALASRIRPQVTAGDRVLLIADNSAAYLATAVAIWRAGAVLVSIYPSSSSEEIGYAIEHSEPVLVITDNRAQARVPATDLPSLTISNQTVSGGGPTAGDSETSALLDSASPDPGSLALICYTSGSTARPKAVMHSHAGVVGASLGYSQVWHLGPADRTLVCLPMAWAFGLITTSMATLVSGGVVDISSRMRPEAIIEAITERGVTFLAGVTTMFLRLNEHLDTLSAAGDFSSLRLCISGGEPRNETAFDRWESRTGCPVHDVYAASECFPAVTYDPIADPRPRPGSSGQVAPGAKMRILDEHGHAVPDGQPGEAYWQGAALFLGYWRDPANTAAALTADGWYRTKDLVRRDPDGYVYVLGRLSDMIIRAGSNVSPAEVEAVLLRSPSVRAAAVVGVPDPAAGQAVAAVIVPAAGHQLTVSDVADLCRAHVAGYKVPTELLVVDELPLNARTGKVDKAALARRFVPQESRA